jgi:hypothetical protein
LGCTFSLPEPLPAAALATAAAAVATVDDAVAAVLEPCAARKLAMPPWLRALRPDRAFPLRGRVGASVTGAEAFGATANTSVLGLGDTKEAAPSTGEACIVCSAPPSADGASVLSTSAATPAGTGAAAAGSRATPPAADTVGGAATKPRPEEGRLPAGAEGTGTLEAAWAADRAGPSLPGRGGRM